MIGVVLAAHGEVAPALLAAAESIVGHLDRVQAVTLEAGMSPDRLRAAVKSAVHAVDDGDGVLVLCDMFGGTPSNVCLSTDCGAPIEVVTGVNLPMLLKVATARASGLALEPAAEMLAAYGQRHISCASQQLRDRQQRETAAAQQGATR